MSNERRPNDASGVPEAELDVAELEALAAHRGPTTRLDEPPQDGAVLLDYRDTDSNRATIAAILSARAIPFHLAERSRGWSGGESLHLRVPVALARRADALLSAAADAGLVERVHPGRAEGSPGAPPTNESGD